VEQVPLFCRDAEYPTRPRTSDRRGPRRRHAVHASTTDYPILGATPTTYYFDGTRSHSALSSNDGTLTPTRPTATTGADAVSWLPVGSSVYATANTSETEWVVNVEDVAPDGTSKPLTQGALLGRPGPSTRRGRGG
jgi:hypothetical protein